MSNVTRKILFIVSSFIDELIEDEEINIDEKYLEKEISNINFSPAEIIRVFPLFDNKDFSFPEIIGHMDFEAIEVDNDYLFVMPEIKVIDKTVFNIKTGKKIEYESIAPKIACKTKMNLDNQNSVVILSMRNCFSFVSEAIFELRYGLTQKEAEGVLTSIISKIIISNNWSFSQALFSILIRDVIEPTIVLSSKTDSLHETIRFFYTEKDACRWSLVPYHSPSLKFEEFIVPGHKDFPPANLNDFREF